MGQGFKKYIYDEKIYESANWVILRVLFIFVSNNGNMQYGKFLEHFCRYYQRRLDAGLVVERPNTRIAGISVFQPDKVAFFVRENVLPELCKMGFLELLKYNDDEYIGFTKDIWADLTNEDRAKLLAEIEEKLEVYFTENVPYPEGTLPVPCVFCERKNLKIVKENNFAFSVFDIFPAVPGHCLIIPKRHIRDIFGLSSEEIAAMLELLKEMKGILESRYKPDGYNVGFNIGYAAGQTVMHAHMHCFPRKWGDVENPRGGMRNIIPNWFEYPKG